MLNMIVTMAALAGSYLFIRLMPTTAMMVSHNMVLIFGTLFILLHSVGLRQGLRYTGILFTLNMIVRVLAG